MNVLGLFLAKSLQRNVVEGGRRCALTGALTVESEGMRASVVFGEEILVTREETKARARLSAPMAVFVSALVEPRLSTFLKVKLRGNPLFAYRVMGVLKP